MKKAPPNPLPKDAIKNFLKKKGIKDVKIIKRTDGGVSIIEKMDAFLEEFANNGGNAVKAAMTISKTKNYGTAAQVATHYMEKARELGRLYLEKKGYGYGKLLDIAAKKMEESKSPEWWDRLMKLANYEDFINKKERSGPNIVTIVAAHKNTASRYIEGQLEEVEFPTEKDED